MSTRTTTITEADNTEAGELVNDHQKGTLLILEDYDAIRAFYSSHFEQRGYEVFSAVRLPDAVDLAEIEAPTVIIIDFDLSSETAENAVMRLHRHSPKSEIIVLGGLDKPDINKRLKAAGAIKHLSKAYDLTTVDQILEGR